MLARRQKLGVERVERREQKTRVANRVDADVPLAAVRGSAMHDDVDPHEPLVRRHDREIRRLGHDRGIGAKTIRHDSARAHARVLLVDDSCENNLTIERATTRGRGASRRRAHRRHARFHVRRAATIKSAVAHGRVPGCMRHSFDADDIDVAVEHQRATAGQRVADAGNDIRAARRCLTNVDAKAPRR